MNIYLNLKTLSVIALSSLLTSASLLAHDTWIQTGASYARTNDVVHVDLMLGNHGNGHRDYKISSKISLPPWTLEVIDPQGNRSDIKTTVVDAGYGPKEGHWSARFLTGQSGLYQVIHSLDTLHGTTRALKTSKAYVLAADTFDGKLNVERKQLFSFDKNLELVLLTPLTSVQAGKEIEVQIKHHGKAITDQLVSFIPRGVALAEGFDEKYERKSDDQGVVRFTLEEANHLLVVAHRAADDESGTGFVKTHYSATLALPVPKRPLDK